MCWNNLRVFGAPIKQELHGLISLIHSDIKVVLFQLFPQRFLFHYYPWFVCQMNGFSRKGLQSQSSRIYIKIMITPLEKKKLCFFANHPKKDYLLRGEKKHKMTNSLSSALLPSASRSNWPNRWPQRGAPNPSIHARVVEGCFGSRNKRFMLVEKRFGGVVLYKNHITII